MREKDLPWCLLKVGQPAEEPRLVGVPGKPGHLDDLRRHGVVSSMNSYFLMTIDNLTSQRALGLVSNKQDRRFRTFDIVTQVVLDPARGTHA